MSRSPNKMTLLITAAVLILLVPALLSGSGPTAAPSAQVSNDQPTVLTLARDFLLLAYPELSGKNVSLEIQTSQPIDASWHQVYDIRYDIKRYNPLSEARLNPPLNARTGKRIVVPPNFSLLRGDLWFNRSGRLHLFSAGDCTLAESKRNQTIRRLVERHPEWSESRALTALSKAGAAYLPDNKRQFLNAIDINKYRPFLGPFTVKAVEFNGLTEPHEGDYVHLEWLIKLDVENSVSPNSDYLLIFEPFRGRLIDVIAESR